MRPFGFLVAALVILSPGLAAAQRVERTERTERRIDRTDERRATEQRDRRATADAPRDRGRDVSVGNRTSARSDRRAHIARCRAAYRSYDARTDRYQVRRGVTRRCRR